MIFQSAAGKHKKQFKGKLKPESKAGSLVSFGECTLKASAKHAN